MEAGTMDFDPALAKKSTILVIFFMVRRLSENCTRTAATATGDIEAYTPPWFCEDCCESAFSPTVRAVFRTWTDAPCNWGVKKNSNTNISEQVELKFIFTTCRATGLRLGSKNLESLQGTQGTCTFQSKNLESVRHKFQMLIFYLPKLESAEIFNQTNFLSSQT
jgi:hypothetical protein